MIPAFGPIRACPHLLANMDADYYWHFTGEAKTCLFLCIDCHGRLRKAETVDTEALSPDQVTQIIRAGYVDGTSGIPGVIEQSCAEPGDVVEQVLPNGPADALTALPGGDWLILRRETASVWRFDPDRGTEQYCMAVSLQEAAGDAWCGHVAAWRVLADPSGRYAALVHDFGRYGSLLDLHERRVVATLDGGDYHPETVPFSACFVLHEGRPVLIHRTAWNRLDATDAETGRLLTERDGLVWEKGQPRPPHTLDYFHGALHPSPSGERVLDDGWVWHPVGLACVLRAREWLSGDRWAADDGLPKWTLQQRDDWNAGVVWLDENRVVIEQLAFDAQWALARDMNLQGTTTYGAGWTLVFDLSRNCYDLIAGPRGTLFADGQRLFSAGSDGLSIWDAVTGARIGRVSDFVPACQHPGRRELVQLQGERLIVWRY